VGRKQETNKSKENAFLHYLQTKKKAEELVKREKDNFRNTTVARISSPIGKKTRPNQILLALVERAKKNMPLILWGNPNRMGNYLYLKDLGAIIPELIKKRGHAIYTIRNKCNISDYSLAYLIKCKLKSKSKICVKKKYFSKILKKTHEVKWGRAGKTNIRKIILNVAKNKY
jgi:dTDP-D-glucose 4,6-dehydratase